MAEPRPDICRKRGCYIRPKSLWPEWDALQERCPDCPYQPKLEEKEK